MNMDVSVVISTHNQKERLRLVLAGLRAQTFSSARFEVIVVDDGCTDGTGMLLKEVALQMPLSIIPLMPNQGRCRARNRGASAARGQVIAFLDGDALPHPEWLQRHWEVFEQYGPNCLLCGAEWSLPDLEHLQDPQVGTFVEGPIPSVVCEHLRRRREEIVVTEDMICRDFERIHSRAMEGGYPFPELQRLQQQTKDLLEQYPGSPIGWIAFYPHNGLVPRAAFERAGGFDPEIPFSEGWELAYRLQKRGLKPHFVAQARTYHLYHYHGFSEPSKGYQETLTRWRAVEYMARKNQDPGVLLVLYWLASIWPDPFLPEEMILLDLVRFHARYQEITVAETMDVETLLCRHPRCGWAEGRLEPQVDRCEAK